MLRSQPASQYSADSSLVISYRHGRGQYAGKVLIEAAGGHLCGMLAAAGGIGTNGGDLVIVTGYAHGKPFATRSIS